MAAAMARSEGVFGSTSQRQLCADVRKRPVRPGESLSHRRALTLPGSDRTPGGTSLDYETGRPGFESGSYPNKSEHAPRRCTLGKESTQNMFSAVLETLGLEDNVPVSVRKSVRSTRTRTNVVHVEEGDKQDRY
ncbi:hypothetical protein Bbelb_025550 [Branchiostoma belcheri]|nr:hypothetical protein Bbelb_025550 [Branchiostoma belcheri]